jgi:hypothetical protein
VTARRARAVSRFESRLARGAASEVVAKSGRRRHPGAPDLDPTPTRRTVHPDTGTRVTGQVESPHPAATLPADIAADLAAGRLEQVCPTCGLREAAGGYCTACATPTGPADWRRGTSRKAQGEASRARVHSDAETGATALETAKSEPLGLWPA